MEDILEEIVGDISDEYDEEQPLYSIAADGSYLFEGKTPLEDFVKITGVEERDFKEMAEEVDTLAGLLLEPVSYTHLDVYKRQILHTSISNKVGVSISNNAQATTYGGTSTSSRS